MVVVSSKLVAIVCRSTKRIFALVAFLIVCDVLLFLDRFRGDDNNINNIILNQLLLPKEEKKLLQGILAHQDLESSSWKLVHLESSQHVFPLSNGTTSTFVGKGNITTGNENGTRTPTCFFNDTNNITMDQNTCASHFTNHPNIAQECLKDPNLKKCILECFDSVADRALPIIVMDHKKTHDDKRQLVSNASSNTSLWPGLEWHGEWMEDPEYCNSVEGTVNHCFLKKYRFSIPDDWKPSSAKQLCQTLSQFNISDIRLYGDSLVRHVAQAMVLVLRNETTLTFNGRKRCIGDHAFSEKGCRISSFAHSVCAIGESNLQQKPVKVHFLQHNPVDRLQRENFVATNRSYPSGKTLFVFGIGNHPPIRGNSNVNRLGILNWTAYEQLYFGDGTVTLPTFAQSSDRDDDYLIWLPTHFKMRIGRTDETNERALQFMKESNVFFSRLGALTVNTFQMTEQVSRFFVRGCENSTLGLCTTYYERDTCQVTQATWDGYHYALTINVWKAQLILRRFFLFKGVSD